MDVCTCHRDHIIHTLMRIECEPIDMDVRTCNRNHSMHISFITREHRRMRMHHDKYYFLSLLKARLCPQSECNVLET